MIILNRAQDSILASLKCMCEILLCPTITLSLATSLLVLDNNCKLVIHLTHHLLLALVTCWHIKISIGIT